MSAWRDPNTTRIGAIGLGEPQTSLVYWDCDGALDACTGHTLVAPPGYWSSPLALGTSGPGVFRALVAHSGPGNTGGPKWLECAAATGTCSLKDAPIGTAGATFAAKSAGKTLVAFRRGAVASVVACDASLTSCPVSEVAADATRSASAEQTDAVVNASTGGTVAVSTNPSLNEQLTVFICQPGDGSCIDRTPGNTAALSGAPQHTHRAPRPRERMDSSRTHLIWKRLGPTRVFELDGRSQSRPIWRGELVGRTIRLHLRRIPRDLPFRLDLVGKRGGVAVLRCVFGHRGQ
jgi:hypothetical protein